MLRNQDWLSILLELVQDFCGLALQCGNQFSSHEVILKWHLQKGKTGRNCSRDFMQVKTTCELLNFLDPNEVFVLWWRHASKKKRADLCANTKPALGPQPCYIRRSPWLIIVAHQCASKNLTKQKQPESQLAMLLDVARRW